jgi:predicted nucleotidyltransferase component of viral defense system
MDDVNDLAIQANLSERQKVHVQLMANVARSLSDTPMVLKGGTALLLAYGLDRHSTDLDFDSAKAIRLEHRLTHVPLPANVEILGVDCLKDTQTTLRYRLNYQTEYGIERLKIETSLRAPPEESEMVNGIRVYGLSTLLNQKLSAIEHRTTARDLYDIHFLVHNHPEAITDMSEKKLETLFYNMDDLEKRFAPAFREDAILEQKDLSTLLLQLNETMEQNRIQPKVQVWLQDETAISFMDKFLHEKELGDYRNLLERYENGQCNAEEEHELLQKTEAFLENEEDKVFLQTQYPNWERSMQKLLEKSRNHAKGEEAEQDQGLSF